jgi:hypothetical protein
MSAPAVSALEMLLSAAICAAVAVMVAAPAVVLLMPSMLVRV